MDGKRDIQSEMRDVLLDPEVSAMWRRSARIWKWSHLATNVVP